MRLAKTERKTNTTVRDVKNERDSGHAQLKDYGRKHNVNIRWGWNQAVEKDRICGIEIDGKEALLDVEELQRFLRWV